MGSLDALRARIETNDSWLAERNAKDEKRNSFVFFRFLRP
jgi:hypothetical protein